MHISSYSTQTGHSFSDFTITPNFSLGFNDSRLDLLNNASTTHARIHTAQTQTNMRKLRRQKSSLCPTSSEGSRGRWHRTPDLIRGFMHRAATGSSHNTHCLCHLSHVHTCKENCPHLADCAVLSLNLLVCWYKAQPRPGSCT